MSSDVDDARAAAAELIERYGQATVAEADVVVALGGDGFLLQTLRETMSTGKLVYGMNRGTIGFLMNEFRAEGLPDRIADALPETIRPLEMETETADRRKADRARHQRGRALAPVLPDGQDQDHDRRQGAAGRIALRRRHGGDARRLHRLQPLRLRADPAARRAASGADAGQPLPAAPLARRAALQQGDGALRHVGAGASGR